MAVLGILARIRTGDRQTVLADLVSLAGVTPFSLDERDPLLEGQIGILIEDASLDGAHARLTSEVSRLPGILAVWPVFAHLEPEQLPLPDGGCTARRK